MNLTTRRLVALAGALAIALGAAACSKSEPSATSTAGASTTAAPAPKAAELLAKAKANALAAKSAVFTGQVQNDGETMKLDFKGTNDASTADITIEPGSGGKIRLISVGGFVYMQGDAAFWKEQGAPAEVQNAGDKFVKAPADAGGLTEDMTIASFLEEAFAEVSASDLSDTVGEEKVNGVDCWVLSDKQGKAEGTLHVSKAKLELVRFTGSSKTPGQIDFSRWNEDLGIKAPSADQILDIG